MARYRDNYYGRQRNRYDYEREGPTGGFSNRNYEDERYGDDKPYRRDEVESRRTSLREGLFHLSDTNLLFTEDREDIRGRKVLDANGKEIGTIDDLLVDERNRKVRFVQISSGGFLGLGATKFMIPVEAISQINNDEVIVNESRDNGGVALRYSPQLTETRDTDNRSNWSWGASYMPLGGYAPWADFARNEETGFEQDHVKEAYKGRGPRGYKRSDERIIDNVNERLARDPFLDARDIEVSVSGGEVTLNGTVRNRHDKRRAEDLAVTVYGVEDVQNSLRVKRYDNY